MGKLTYPLTFTIEPNNILNIERSLLTSVSGQYTVIKW